MNILSQHHLLTFMLWFKRKTWNWPLFSTTTVVSFITRLVYNMFQVISVLNRNKLQCNALNFIMHLVQNERLVCAPNHLWHKLWLPLVHTTQHTYIYFSNLAAYICIYIYIPFWWFFFCGVDLFWTFVLTFNCCMEGSWMMMTSIN